MTIKEFDLKKSNIHGKGIFSNIDLKKGQNLFATHRASLSFSVEKTTMWTNLSPNFLYNHSHDPNCASITKGKIKYLTTLRDIFAGEELLVDYTQDLDLEQPQSDWINKNRKAGT